MEKAIHLTNLNNLKHFQKGMYQRVYWGTEFCQNLIPTNKDTNRIIRFIRKNHLKFTFVTPFVTERGLNRLNNLFCWLKNKKVDCEIIVNDWGVLAVLYSKFRGYFRIALGRLLVRQQRDPAMKRVLEKQLPFAFKGKDGKIRIIVHRPPAEIYQKGIKASYINSPLFQDFFSKYGIKRVELNNLIQGLDLRGVKLKKTLYTPYVNISTTRFCPMNTKYQKTYRINVCKRECQRYYDILSNKALPLQIYKRGNTTFYENPLNIEEAGRYGVDRVVFQPELPF